MEWVTTSTILDGLGDHANADAWQMFAARFRAPVLGYARQLGLSEADAEDVAQETLLVAANALRDGAYQRGKGRLSKYLFGVAHRQALGKRRRVARDAAAPLTESDQSALDESDSQLTRIWERQWERAVLEHCLRQLRWEVDPQSYGAFELTVRDERSPAEAAELLGVPVKTVYNAKHRLLKRVRALRDAMDEE